VGGRATAKLPGPKSEHLTTYWHFAVNMMIIDLIIITGFLSVA